MRRPWRTDVVCQQFVELVTDYLEGALPRRLNAAVERHIAACPHCNAYLDQVRATIDLAGSLREEDLPGELVDALMRAFDDYQSGRDSDPSSG